MNASELKVKFIKILKYIMPEVAVIVFALVFDLVSKSIVQNNMQLGETIVIIPKLLNFSYTINTRAAFSFDFGLGDVLGDKGIMIFFIVVTIIAVGAFGTFLFLPPKKGMLFRVSLSLIIAGAIGNLIDRIAFNYVRDFIQIEYLGLEIFGSKTFAIFNYADSCVVIGVIMLIEYFLFFDKTLFSPKKKETAAGEPTEEQNSMQSVEESSTAETIAQGESAERVESENSISQERNEAQTDGAEQSAADSGEAQADSGENHQITAQGENSSGDADNQGGNQTSGNQTNEAENQEAENSGGNQNDK